MVEFKQIEAAVKQLPEGKVRVTLMAGRMVHAIGEFNKAEMTLKSGKLSRYVYNWFVNDFTNADSFHVEIVPTGHENYRES